MANSEHREERMTEGFDNLQLSKADAELLDKLVDVGFELDQLEFLTSEDEQRAKSILAILGLLESYPVDDASDTLIDATLVRIDQYESQRAARMQVVVPELETTKRGFRLRMPDFIGVAAAVLQRATALPRSPTRWFFGTLVRLGDAVGFLCWLLPSLCPTKGRQECMDTSHADGANQNRMRSALERKDQLLCAEGQQLKC